MNLGGWFVLEPFITPALYQKYPGAVDEWTLSTLMAADTANGGLNQLEDHYNTFIVSVIFVWCWIIALTLALVDRAGHCSNSRCRLELDQGANTLLGH